MTAERVVRLLVSGRVQGVGFRWYVARHAQTMAVRGWVRNLADGSVEVVAAGTATAVAELEALVRRGPRFSHVENVDKFDVPHDLIDTNSFNIK